MVIDKGEYQLLVAMEICQVDLITEDEQVFCDAALLQGIGDLSVKGVGSLHDVQHWDVSYL